MNEKITEKALVYEKNTRISVPTYDGLFMMVRSYFRAQLGEKKASLLVVGAGGGNELSAWGPSNPKWTFTGVDPSEEMLHIAKNKAVQLGLENRVELIQGTIDDIPLSKPKFDAASCILVLHFIDDEQEKLKLLRTIKDNLKSGAPFVLVSAYGDRDSSELYDRINVWKSFFLDAGYEKSKADDMGKVIMNISFIPESQIAQLLKDAGFTNITRFYSTGLFAGWICQAE
ncbi:methyltransferase domain-containing protein [Lysinibacillus telephonicus]|uniref:Class I SAM-dependent methyltransferase n=1 Tax=Lysinibacillus telephonicus TaxID=1714840 RepID=A0A431UEM0_9BACI|nr:class I SAM-dependent methyltransferase [Lysinibacillus telephonicus]RTQ87570.1 class I SAM-dependent methyltransferase [Lysinibacillus telephonicus]